MYLHILAVPCLPDSRVPLILLPRLPGNFLLSTSGPLHQRHSLPGAHFPTSSHPIPECPAQGGQADRTPPPPPLPITHPAQPGDARLLPAYARTCSCQAQTMNYMRHKRKLSNPSTQDSAPTRLQEGRRNELGAGQEGGLGGGGVSCRHLHPMLVSCCSPSLACWPPRGCHTGENPHTPTPVPRWPFSPWIGFQPKSLSTHPHNAIPEAWAALPCILSTTSPWEPPLPSLAPLGVILTQVPHRRDCLSLQLGALCVHEPHQGRMAIN